MATAIGVEVWKVVVLIGIVFSDRHCHVCTCVGTVGVGRKPKTNKVCEQNIIFECPCEFNVLPYLAAI